MAQSQKPPKRKSKCSIPGCNRKRHACGLCNIHYSKAYKLQVATDVTYNELDTTEALLSAAESSLRSAISVEEKTLFRRRIKALKYNRDVVQELSQHKTKLK